MTPLIHWDFSGKNNADAGTIVEDLTGNGYDLELKNFAFDNESGYNGYPFDFRVWNIVVGTGYDSNFPIIQEENKVIFNGTIADGAYHCAVKIGSIESTVSTFVLKVSGLKENQSLRWYNYKYETEEDSSEVTLLYNGINVVDGSGTKLKYLGYYSIYDGNVGKTLNNVTVEIFPLYPDQLVFNKNKAYTVKHVKINTTRGFTAIIRRQFIQEDIKTIVLGQPGNSGMGFDFYIRDYKPTADGEWMVFNFGSNGIIYHDPTGDLMWSTLSKFFNGQVVTINKPSLESPDDAPLILGTYNYNNAGEGNFAIREVYIFDRDLTQSQIEKFISDNMIPLPEVYYDVEKQGTLNEHTTKDKLIDFSGNENHGTLHNFTFDESNGWGYYPLDFVEGEELQSGNGWSKSGNKITITGTASRVISYCSMRNVKANDWTKDIVIPSFKCKITGLDSIKETQPTISLTCQKVRLDSSGNNSRIMSTISKDGIWEIPSYTVPISEKTDTTSSIRLVDIAFLNFVSDDEHQITVEFLPTDEDCLRFNATDHTYVSLDTLTKGFKTIFMVFNPASMAQIIYDQRAVESPGTYYRFAIYGEDHSVAWNARNTGGVTYINGELNNTRLSSSLIGQKHCATLVNDTVEDEDTTTPLIGRRTPSDDAYWASLKFYKFLGFKEALSEKQIKMVIEKYGLQVD